MTAAEVTALLADLEWLEDEFETMSSDSENDRACCLADSIEYEKNRKRAAVALTTARQAINDLTGDAVRARRALAAIKGDGNE